jgi:hypothetical protein
VFICHKNAPVRNFDMTTVIFMTTVWAEDELNLFSRKERLFSTPFKNEVVLLFGGYNATIT